MMLKAQQEREFEKLLMAEPYQGVRAMNTTWFEKGEDNGQRKLLGDQLNQRFGPLSKKIVKRLEKLPRERLQSLGRDILSAKSLQELGLED